MTASGVAPIAFASGSSLLTLQELCRLLRRVVRAFLFRRLRSGPELYENEVRQKQDKSRSGGRRRYAPMLPSLSHPRPRLKPL